MIKDTPCSVWVFFVLTSSLTMIACTASALNRFWYLCVLSCRFRRSIWIGGIISSCASSTLVDSTALRYSTLGGGSLTLGILVVLGLADVVSSVVFVVSSENIADISLSAVKVLSFKCEKGCVGCGCFNASDNSNAALAAVSADDNVGILYCLRKNSTVSHTHVSGVFVNVYCPSPVMI